MTILVFKTNLTPDKLSWLLEPMPHWLIDVHWNIDWEDCDRVFRVEAPTVAATTIEDDLRAKGIECEELR